VTTRNNFRQFHPFGGIISPRGYEVMPRDHRPVSNVYTSNSIRISPIVTQKTTEFKAVPVTAVNVSAKRTSSTSVLGTNQLRGYAFSFSLVVDHKLTHSIGPTIDPTLHILALSSAGLSNIRQLLHDNFSGSDRLSILHQLFRSYMYQLSGNFGFMSGHSFKKPLGRLGSLGLNSRTDLPNTPSFMVQRATRKSKGFTIGGICSGKDSFYARVDSDNTTFGFCFRDNYIITKKKIPVLTSLLKFGIFPNFNRRNSVIINTDRIAPKAKSFGFGKGKIPLPDNRNNLPFKHYRMPYLLGSLGKEGCCDISEGRASKLRGQSEFLTDSCIMRSVEAK